MGPSQLRHLVLWLCTGIWSWFPLVVWGEEDAPRSTPLPQMQGASIPEDIQKYYPQRKYITQWYVVKDVQSGKMVDFISYTFIGQIPLDSGRTLSLIENVNAGGVNIDYQEITPEQVLLHRLVRAPQEAEQTLHDTSFSPPFPLLRAPLEVGRSWSENIGGDNSYIYRVSSRMTMSALGKEWHDCLQVVRTRGGTVDYKTIYCPELGIAAFEILASNGNWLRAELTDVAGELALIGVRVASNRCEHIFDPLSFAPGETLTVSVTPPNLQPVIFQRSSTENIHIGLDTRAPWGRWVIKVQGKQQVAFSVFQWTGRCRAGLLTPPPSLKPSLILIGQEADEGEQIYMIAGIGWKAGEPLSFTQAGPGWHQQTKSLEKASREGVSAIVRLPFKSIPAPGEYTLTMKGETQTAMLTITCRKDGLCFGPTPRLTISTTR